MQRSKVRHPKELREPRIRVGVRVGGLAAAGRGGWGHGMEMARGYVRDRGGGVQVCCDACPSLGLLMHFLLTHI